MRRFMLDFKGLDVVGRQCDSAISIFSMKGKEFTCVYRDGAVNVDDFTKSLARMEYSMIK